MIQKYTLNCGMNKFKTTRDEFSEQRWREKIFDFLNFLLVGNIVFSTLIHINRLFHFFGTSQPKKEHHTKNQKQTLQHLQHFVEVYAIHIIIFCYLSLCFTFHMKIYFLLFTLFSQL